jgi:hypothetical protein
MYIHKQNINLFFNVQSKSTHTTPTPSKFPRKCHSSALSMTPSQAIPAALPAAAWAKQLCPILRKGNKMET